MSNNNNDNMHTKKNEESSSIQSTKYHGHQGSVLCLDITKDESFLLSGSEDKTARLWDIREENKRRACLCIQTEGDVLSVAFEPPKPSPVSIKTTTTTTTTMDNTATTSSSLLEGQSMFAKNLTVYLSVDKFVYEYDLRNTNAPILRQPTNNLSSILQNQDEVNQIGISYYTHQYSKTSKRKGSKNSNKKSNTTTSTTTDPSLYLAAADDCGTIRFMDHNSKLLSSTSTPSSQILHHDPNGVAVVPSCSFRPIISNNGNNNNSSKSLELASGGTDCKIHLWDILKPKRPISSYTITPQQEDQQQQESSSKPQVCNPPMVHTLCWSPSGRLLAAGLGDGNCSIFSIENRSLIQVGLLTPGHDSSVASVLFPSFANGNERILLSAGNDGAILCWDLGSNIFLSDQLLLDDEDVNNTKKDNTQLNDLSQLFSSSLLVRQDNKNPNKKKPSSSSSSLPRVLFGIPHGTKPNWMVSRKSPSTLFVADTSNDITAYIIPQGGG